APAFRDGWSSGLSPPSSLGLSREGWVLADLRVANSLSRACRSNQVMTGGVSLADAGKRVGVSSLKEVNLSSRFSCFFASFLRLLTYVVRGSRWLLFCVSSS